MKPKPPKGEPDIRLETTAGGEVKAWRLEAGDKEKKLYVVSEGRKKEEDSILAAQRKHFEEGLAKLHEGLADKGRMTTARQGAGERRPPQGEVFQGGPAVLDRCRRGRKGRERRRRSFPAQPPACRSRRGQGLVLAARRAGQRGRRSRPALILAALRSRSHFPVAQIGARVSAGVPPAGQADPFPSLDRGAGLPSPRT